MILLAIGCRTYEVTHKQQNMLSLVVDIVISVADCRQLLQCIEVPKWLVQSKWKKNPWPCLHGIARSQQMYI